MPNWIAIGFSAHRPYLLCFVIYLYITSQAFDMSNGPWTLGVWPLIALPYQPWNTNHSFKNRLEWTWNRLSRPSWPLADPTRAITRFGDRFGTELAESTIELASWVPNRSDSAESTIKSASWVPNRFDSTDSVINRSDSACDGIRGLEKQFKKKFRNLKM